MRRILARLLAIAVGLFLLSCTVWGQGFSFSCTRDTIIPGCATNPCFTLRGLIPDIRAVSDSYYVNRITNGSTNCMPIYTDVSGLSDVGTQAVFPDEDFYSSNSIPIGFPFLFYGSTYNNLVIGSNGTVSFDISLAGQYEGYQLFGNLKSTDYAQAIIMGPYHDVTQVDPSPGKLVHYKVVGTAPYRKWVVSFYKMPLWSSTATPPCPGLTENTHQIVLYESTGIVEVLIFSKQICLGWNNGKAMIGMQNFDRTKGQTVPGRGATDPPWGTVNMNEAWRFVPMHGASLLKRVELYDLSGALVATGTTNNLGNGTLEALFPNICPPANATTTYIIKPVYSKIDDPAVEVFGADTVRVTRSAPTNLNADAVIDPASCGLNNGKITVNVPAGTGVAPFQYSVDGGTLQTTNQFTNLAPGSHTVHAEDAGGCSTDLTVNITTSGTNMPLTYTSTNTTCSGATNGTITVNPPSGVLPITYSINNSTYGANNVFSNLAAGTYEIKVKDGGTCEGTISNIVITQGPTITMTSIAYPPSCPGSNNGRIIATGATGTPPFQYSINNGTFQVSNEFPNLTPATYFLLVKDAAGCVSTSYRIQVVPPGNGTLTGTAAPTASTCGGLNDGTITVTATAGSGPYEYSADNGTTWQSSNVFNNLAPNTYQVKIRETSGCTSGVIPATVTNSGTSITGTAATIATSCNGVNDGSITVTATSGTGPYEYSIDNGTTWQPGNTFTGLGANTYSVKIRENGICTSNTITATVAAGATLTGTTTPTSTSCNGASNGSITVTPTSGVGPYEYSIDNGTTWQPGNTFTGLAANTYSIKIRENGVCTSNTIATTVTAGATLTGTATPIATSCNGANNGSITVTATSGTGPYEYSIDNGTTWQPGNTFTGLAANTYSVKIRENGVCTSNTIAATVAAGATLSGTAAPVATSCNGASNGSITVTPTSGVGPYEYSIDNGATWQPGNTFTGLAANTYSVKIRENGVCTSNTITATVTAGATLTGTATPASTSCDGASNGSITVTATSGTGPYEYSIDNGATWQPGNSFTGLAANTYSVKIRENGVCTSNTITTTVAAGAALTGTAIPVGTSCNGASNGSITVTATSGTGPYEYSIDNGTTWQPGNSFTGLVANTYSVKIREAGICTSNTITAIVEAGLTLSGTTTQTATSCNGANNGSITVTATSGTGPYEYSIDNGTTWQPGNTFTGLAANTYSVKIRENGVCTSNTITATVAAGSTLTGTANAIATSCNGASNGSITITATSGVGPYEYSIDDGTTWQPGNSFTGLAANTYSVKIRENGVCTSNTITATVAAGATLTGTVAPIATSCNGASNGSITVTATSGVGPYEYSIDNGTTWQPGNTFTGLAATTYSVKIRENGVCTSDIITATVPAGATLTGTANPVATSCNGASNGSITVTATSGVGPYEYSIDDGTTWQPGNTFTGLAANTYSVKIRENGVCTSNTLTAIVNAGATLTGTATAVPTACAGINNGSITVTPDPAFTGPFEYSLDNGTFQVANNFTGVSANSHNVVIRNTTGCSSVNIPVTVPAGSAIIGSVDFTNVSCNGGLNGEIIVNPGNGSAPHTYSLNGGTPQTNNVFANLGANTYSIVIRDAFGCASAPIDVTISEPAPLTAALPSVTPVICNGANNGTIKVFPSGGTSPYSFSLDNTNFQASNTFNLSQGIYAVYIKDAKGCVLQFNDITVTQPQPLTANVASTTNATCNGGNDGKIEITASGGTTPYQYSVDGITYQPSNILDVQSGTYTAIKIKDANNCEFSVPAVTVGLTDNLTLTAVTPAPICEGSNVKLDLNSNGADFAWDATSVGLSSLDVPDPVASPASTTTYTVTATLGSCTKTADVTVNVMPAPVPDAGDGGTICFGQDLLLQGSGGVTYAWTPSTYLDDATIPNPTSVNPAKTITYTLTVRDANDCPSLVPDEVTVIVTPPIKVFVSPADTLIYEGDQIRLFASINSTDTSYTWTPATALNDPNISNPVVSGLHTGDVINYKVNVTTSAGCQGDGFVTVRVYAGPDVYVPTAFTPNKDGKNEIFIPVPVGIRQLNYFRIFNRWGELVYITKTLNQGWDGRAGGIDQPTGAYIWAIEGVTKDGRLIRKQGTVMLVR